jgi:hypothetical protein
MEETGNLYDYKADALYNNQLSNYHHGITDRRTSPLSIATKSFQARKIPATALINQRPLLSLETKYLPKNKSLLQVFEVQAYLTISSAVARRY